MSWKKLRDWLNKRLNIWAIGFLKYDEKLAFWEIRQKEEWERQQIAWRQNLSQENRFLRQRLEAMEK